MAKIKALYAKAEEIPEGFAELYTERNGQFELTGVEGVKTEADVTRVTTALNKERKDHKETKDKLGKFGDVDPETLPAQLEELEATKAQLAAFTKDGKLDETKLEPIIEARVNRAVGPLQRDKAALERKLTESQKLYGEKEAEVGKLQTTIVQTAVERSIRDAAVTSKVIATAIDDAVLNGTRVFEITENGSVLTKDIAGTVAGLSPAEWFKDMQERKPHWWPQSQGGGAGGGKGGGAGTGADNPWSASGWNLTKQGQYVRQHGAEKAAATAAAVGSSLGATKPAAKAA